MMDPTVSRVDSPAGLEAAFDVRRDVFIEGQGVDEDVEMDGKDDDATHLLATDGDRAVGTARLRVVDPGVGKVERVAVRESHRRRGVGRALVDVLESEAADRGLDRLVLHAQVRVEGFYADLGYETTGDVFQEAGIDHVRMEKRLEDPA